MQSFDLDSYFSPLGKEYCAYFYWLTIIAFFLFVLALGNSVFLVLKGKANPVTSIVLLLGPFLLYFNNRLLYTMCMR